MLHRWAVWCHSFAVGGHLVNAGRSSFDKGFSDGWSGLGDLGGNCCWVWLDEFWWRNFNVGGCLGDVGDIGLFFWGGSAQ